jgi:hypothetical protein
VGSWALNELFPIPQSTPLELTDLDGVVIGRTFKQVKQVLIGPVPEKIRYNKTKTNRSRKERLAFNWIMANGKQIPIDLHFGMSLLHRNESIY